MRILLMAICLLLTVIILIEWLLWPSQPNQLNENSPVAVNEEATQAEITSVNGFTLPPLSEFDSIKERPIFIDGRRPLPTTTVVQEETTRPSSRGVSAQPPKMNLSAILIINNEPMVLLRNPPKGSSSRLKVGDEFQGWQVTKITPDRVTLKQSGRSEDFPLRSYKEVPLPRVTKAKKRRPVTKRRTRQPRRPAEAAVDS